MSLDTYPQFCSVYTWGNNHKKINMSVTIKQLNQRTEVSWKGCKKQQGALQLGICNSFKVPPIRIHLHAQKRFWSLNHTDFFGKVRWSCSLHDSMHNAISSRDFFCSYQLKKKFHNALNLCLILGSEQCLKDVVLLLGFFFFFFLNQSKGNCAKLFNTMHGQGLQGHFYYYINVR